MQADRGRTITERARRRQIVEATVAVIAEVGVAKASFTRIAKHAGLSSTSLISYHFAGRADLLDTTLERVLEDFADYVTSRLAQEMTPMRTLLTFCAASVDYIGAHPAEVVALRHLLAAGTRPGKAGIDLAGKDRERLATLLLQGQRTGDFRDFDPDTVAQFVLALRDEVARRSIAEPGLDLTGCKQELIALVERATRKDRS